MVTGNWKINDGQPDYQMYREFNKNVGKIEKLLCEMKQMMKITV